MASNIPEKGRLICTLPNSGEPRTGVNISDLAWEREGRLLIGQWSPNRLYRLTLDEDKRQILEAETLYTDQHSGVSSVSVNESGDIGAVIFDTGVYFHTTNGDEPKVWSPTPAISKLHNVALFKDKYCISSQSTRSTVFVYDLGDKTLVKSIPLNNEDYVNNMTRMDDNRLVISERHTGSLYIVDINTSRVTRVTPKYQVGENVLSDPCGVACDREGRIYVSDFPKNKVVFLSPQGEYLTTLALEGLEYPNALAVCSRPGKCPILAVYGQSHMEVKLYALTNK